MWKLYPQGLGQTQESGRDQGHNTLNAAELGAFCQMAWSQGDDLYGYEDNRVLKGMEYIAKYNLGQDVPYTPYHNSDVTQNVIADKGRGDTRPVWELFYNHYVVLKGLKAPYVTAAAEKVRPEGHLDLYAQSKAMRLCARHPLTGDEQVADHSLVKLARAP